VGLAAHRISVAEFLEIRKDVEKQALAELGSRYDHPNRAEVSLPRLAAIAKGLPKGRPVEQAAWLLRAFALVQPFPDRNQLTGLVAAQLLLGRHDITFRPGAEEAARFQDAVGEMRFVRFGGYDDPGLSVLGDWEDELMQYCRGFIQETLEKAA
jgi:hypothetical protein